MKILVEFKSHSKRIEIEGNAITDEENLKQIIRGQFMLEDSTKFHLQILDKEFNDFCDINSIDEVVNLSKLKVVLEEVDLITPSTSSNIQPSSSKSIEKQLRCESWIPGSTKINLEHFSLPVRSLLQEAQKEFLKSSKLYDPPTIVRKECKTVLENILKRYTVYPTTEQYEEVCWALVNEFPCLREPIGSGISGWKIALRYRMEDARRKSKSLQEVKINAGKRSLKDPHSPAPSKNIKKPKRGEINFAPCIDDSEEELINLKESMKIHHSTMEKEDLCNLLNKTYPLRRNEINQIPKPLKAVQDDWPALFQTEHLTAEVHRLTGINIIEGLQKNINDNLQAIMELLKTKTEESWLQKIPEYFKDKWRFCVEETDESSIGPEARIIQQSPDQFCIKAENVTLMEGIPSMTEAVQNLISIYYACNLKYPSKGENSMVFLQHMCNIKGGKLPQKVINLFSKLKRMNPDSSIL